MEIFPDLPAQEEGQQGKDFLLRADGLNFSLRRVSIPKPGGGERPRGIPTIRNRVVQTAVKLVMEPICEPDFADCSYGFRPGRRAPEALAAMREGLQQGLQVALDADGSSCFDTIPHDQLLIA